MTRERVKGGRSLRVSIISCTPKSPSLREIIPSLERAWTSCGHRFHWRVHLFRYDSRSKLEFFRVLFQADIIVATSATHAAGLLYVIRKKLGLKTPILIHAHGECSAGGSPFVEFIAELMTTQDIFLAASRSEANGIRICFPNAAIRTAPFPILSLYPELRRQTSASRGGSEKPTTFIYAGRITEQKNLHSLLWSLWFLRRREPRIPWRAEFYGYCDGLGSPNMGFRMEDYGTYLGKLCSALGLEDRVSWEGFLPTVELHKKILKRRHIFLSPSLNSDEDFGVAALKSLAVGNAAVLSSWGGHRDFARSFGRQVVMVPVLAGALGPYVPVAKLARGLFRALHMGRARAPVWRGGAAAYTAEGSGILLERYARLPFSLKRDRLAVSSITKKISKRRYGLKPQLSSDPLFAPTPGFVGAPPQVFSNYRDSYAGPFFRAYGLKSLVRTPPRERLIIAPWVHLKPGGIIVRDPHRGPFRFPILPGNSGEGRRMTLFDVFGKAYRISLKTGRWLVDNGLAAPDET